MFSYYGSKSKIVDYYPSPKFGKIIEPFAGSARYALKYYDRDVLLVDKYDVIVKIWHYLQSASKNDILSLPKLGKNEKIPEYLSESEKYLLGFLVVAAAATPQYKTTSFEGIGMNRGAIEKIASSLYKIRHWEIRLGSYEEIQNEEATWFIDPPYQFGGYFYKENNNGWNYNNLAKWCKSRQGQVIVCENTKADWLPFYPMRKLNGAYSTTTEAIWSNYPTGFECEQLSLLT